MIRLHPNAIALLLTGTLFAQDKSQPVVDVDDVRTPDGHTVARIVRAPYDADRHEQTKKIFHHVFAPDGRQLTKGAGGTFPHHRGLFVGWNQTSWGGQRFDFWHGNKGESQRFAGWTTAATHGFGKAWQVATIDWLSPAGELVLRERRALRGRRLGADITALDLTVRLTAEAPVKLAGDAQHAGQQFRALQLFAEDDGPKVTYLRPANAVRHDNDVWTECDWIAAVLPLPDGPVTVLRLEGAGNPHPTTWSTRPYGRFGATFSKQLPAASQLTLHWTYVIALGARDLAFCERMALGEARRRLEEQSKTRTDGQSVEPRKSATRR